MFRIILLLTNGYHQFANFKIKNMRRNIHEAFTPSKDEEIFCNVASDKAREKKLDIIFYFGIAIIAPLVIIITSMLSSFHNDNKEIIYTVALLIYTLYILLMYNVKENNKYHKLIITNKRIWWQNRKRTVSLQWDEIKKCDISFGYKRSYWLAVYKIDGSKKIFHASNVIINSNIISEYINKGYNEYRKSSARLQEIEAKDEKPIMDYNEIIKRPMWKTKPFSFILGIVVIIMLILKYLMLLTK